MGGELWTLPSHPAPLIHYLYQLYRGLGSVGRPSTSGSFRGSRGGVVTADQLPFRGKAAGWGGRIPSRTKKRLVKSRPSPTVGHFLRQLVDSGRATSPNAHQVDRLHQHEPRPNQDLPDQTQPPLRPDPERHRATQRANDYPVRWGPPCPAQRAVCVAGFGVSGGDRAKN